MSQQNSLLGESNNIVLALLGCSFNSQPLTSTEAALSAVFYIIDYMSKDAMEPTKLFGFVKAAKNRLDNYEGKAPTGEDPTSGDRPMRRLGQIVQNGISGSVEVGLQQCALNIYGLPSHNSSENFKHVFTGDAIKAVRVMFGQDPNVDLVDLSDDVHEMSNISTRHPLAVERHAQANREEHTYAKLDANEEIQGSNEECVGNIVRNVEGKPVATSQYLEYIHRGDCLCFMSLSEYACLVRRIDKPMPEISEGKIKIYLSIILN